MRCWIGGEEAEGTCRFCGRAVCKRHAKMHSSLLQVWEDEGSLRGLAVEDALWCGICKIHPNPIDVDFLKIHKERVSEKK
jgi:hypothetical protein